MTPATPTTPVTPSADSAFDAIAADRTLAVVRAPAVPDPAGLCAALAAGGIRAVEFTYTTPDLPSVLHAAREGQASSAAYHVGAGTVLTADQARAAIDHGAEFLVTPAVRPEVAEVAVAAGVPVFLGAMTPTEVARALDLGAAAVKIFPAATLGPRYLRDLRGPFPGVRLVPSGGVNAGNAREFLDQGAFAVCCGTEVVPPDAVARGDIGDISRRAALFVSALAEGSD